MSYRDRTAQNIERSKGRFLPTVGCVLFVCRFHGIMRKLEPPETATDSRPFINFMLVLGRRRHV